MLNSKNKQLCWKYPRGQAEVWHALEESNLKKQGKQRPWDMHLCWLFSIKIATITKITLTFPINPLPSSREMNRIILTSELCLNNANDAAFVIFQPQGLLMQLYS